MRVGPFFWLRRPFDHCDPALHSHTPSLSSPDRLKVGKCVRETKFQVMPIENTTNCSMWAFHASGFSDKWMRRTRALVCSTGRYTARAPVRRPRSSNLRAWRQNSAYLANGTTHSHFILTFIKCHEKMSNGRTHTYRRWESQGDQSRHYHVSREDPWSV